jgi:hypothetical protein
MHDIYCLPQPRFALDTKAKLAVGVVLPAIVPVHE